MEAEDRNDLRKYLIQLADEGNPIDLAFIEKHGGFSNRKAAATWAQRQEVAKTLKCISTGKDKYWCNSWDAKTDNLRHEGGVTRVRAIFRMLESERGHRLGRCFADLVLKDSFNQWELEIDYGTIRSREKMLARFRKHLACDCDLLVVSCTDEKRMRKLMEWSEGIRDGVFFTTLEAIEAAGPTGYVWDFVGRGEESLKRVDIAV